VAAAAATHVFMTAVVRKSGAKAGIVAGMLVLTATGKASEAAKSSK
jgi:hypothetical protein